MTGLERTMHIHRLPPVGSCSLCPSLPCSCSVEDYVFSGVLHTHMHTHTRVSSIEFAGRRQWEETVRVGVKSASWLYFLLWLRLLCLRLWSWIYHFSQLVKLYVWRFFKLSAQSAFSLLTTHPSFIFKEVKTICCWKQWGAASEAQ